MYRDKINQIDKFINIYIYMYLYNVLHLQALLKFMNYHNYFRKAYKILSYSIIINMYCDICRIFLFKVKKNK